MGGATEATLAELLAVAQAMNVNMVKLNAMINQIRQGGGLGSGGGGGSTGSAASSAASGLGKLVSSLNPVTLAMNALEAGATLVGKVFSTMFEIVGKVGSGLMSAATGLINFSVQATTGSARLSDLFNSFKGLPFFIGEAAGLFAKIVSVLEEQLTTYRNLTKIGASFSGNLTLMRDTAAKAQLTLGEFASVVSGNSEIFATLGGNVQKGLDRFVKLQGDLMGPGSAYSKQLLALGYTSAEAAEALASYMRSQGTMNKSQLANDKLITDGVVAYAKELDTISKLTGKSREKIEAELKSVELEETYQQFLAGIADPKQAAAIKSAVANMLNAGGREAAEQLKLAVQGIETAITPGQTALAAATEGLSIEVSRNIAAAINQGKSVEEIGRITREEAMRVGRQQQRLFGELGTQGVAALRAAGSTVVTAGAEFQKYARTVGNLSEADRIAAEQRADQERGNAAALAQAEQNIRNFGNQLILAVDKFIGPGGERLVKFGESITGAISKLVGSKGFQETVDGLSKWFGTTLDKLTNAKTPEEFFSSLITQGKAAFTGIMNTVKPLWNETIAPALINGWNGFIAYMQKEGLPQMQKFYEEKVAPMLSTVFTDIMDFIIYNLRKNSAIARFLFKETDREREEFERSQFESGQMQRNVDRILREYNKKYTTEQQRESTAGREDFEYYKIELERLKEAQRKFAPQPATPVDRPNRGGRPYGTLGVLGQTSEPQSGTVGIEQGERVLNPMETATYNNLEQSIQRLNSLTAQMLATMREQAEYARRNLDATKALSNNLFA